MKLTARRIPLAIVPCVLTFAFPAMAQTLNIADVEGLALKTSPDAQIAGLNYDSGRSRYIAAEGSLKPSISLSSLGATLSGSDAAGSDPNLSPSAGISIKQPLGQFLPAALPTVSGLDWQSAKNDWLSTQLKNEQAAWNLKYQARTAYVNVLKAQANLDLSKEQQKQIETSLLPEANAKFKAGTATKVDVLKVEAQLGNAKLTVMKNQNSLTSAQRDLARLLGQNEIDVNLSLAALPEVDGSTPLPSLREVQGTALSRRIEIKTAEITLENAKASQTKTKLNSSIGIKANASVSKDFNSDLSVSASASIDSRDFNANGSLDASKPRAYNPNSDTSWSVSLGLSSPYSLLDWGKTAQQRLQVKNDVTIAELNLDQAKSDVQTDVEGAYNGLVEARERLSYAKLSQSTAETTLDITKTRYNAQVASTSELMDSEVAAYEARSSVTQAMYDLFLAVDRLDKAIGPEVSNGSERSSAR